jgi:hypothetical protein
MACARAGQLRVREMLAEAPARASTNGSKALSGGPMTPRRIELVGLLARTRGSRSSTGIGSISVAPAGNRSPATSLAR